MELHKIVEKMKEEFPGEIKGANEYLVMAEEAEKIKQHELARHYKEMAREEYTHANSIMRDMKRYGMDIDNEHMKMMHELKEKLMRA